MMGRIFLISQGKQIKCLFLDGSCVFEYMQIDIFPLRIQIFKSKQSQFQAG